MEDIRITDLPDGGCIFEFEGETTKYTAAEIAEMERDYKAAIVRLLQKESRQ